MNQKISYKDLSTDLKVLVVFGWIMVSFFCLGFVLGILEVILG